MASNYPEEGPVTEGVEEDFNSHSTPGLDLTSGNKEESLISLALLSMHTSKIVIWIRDHFFVKILSFGGKQKLYYICNQCHKGIPESGYIVLNTKYYLYEKGPTETGTKGLTLMRRHVQNSPCFLSSRKESGTPKTDPIRPATSYSLCRSDHQEAGCSQPTPSNSESVCDGLGQPSERGHTSSESGRTMEEVSFISWLEGLWGEGFDYAN